MQQLQGEHYGLPWHIQQLLHSNWQVLRLDLVLVCSTVALKRFRPRQKHLYSKDKPNKLTCSAALLNLRLASSANNTENEPAP